MLSLKRQLIRRIPNSMIHTTKCHKKNKFYIIEDMVENIWLFNMSYNHARGYGMSQIKTNKINKIYKDDNIEQDWLDSMALKHVYGDKIIKFNNQQKKLKNKNKKT